MKNPILNKKSRFERWIVLVLIAVTPLLMAEDSVHGGTGVLVSGRGATVGSLR